MANELLIRRIMGTQLTRKMIREGMKKAQVRLVRLKKIHSENHGRRAGSGLPRRINLTVALPDRPGTLPKACNAGPVDIEWVIKDLTKSEVQLCLRESGASRPKGSATSLFQCPRPVCF